MTSDVNARCSPALLDVLSVGRLRPPFQFYEHGTNLIGKLISTNHYRSGLKFLC